MQLGTVVGHATATVKHPTLNGWRLLVVQLTAVDGKPVPMTQRVAPRLLAASRRLSSMRDSDVINDNAM